MTGLLTFSSSDMTGAAKMGLSFAEALRKAGHQVVALCSPPPDHGETVITPLRQAGVEVVVQSGFARPFDLAMVRLIGSLMDSRKIDYVVTFFLTDTKCVAWPAWRRRMPFIISVQNDIRFYGNPVARSIKGWMFGHLFRRTVTRGLCTCQKIQSDLEKHYRVPGNQLEVLPNGIATDRALSLTAGEREQIRQELEVSEGELLFLNVGRICDQKGQMVLLEAIREVAGMGRRFKVFLVGDAVEAEPESVAYRTKIKDYLRQHRLEVFVKLLGWRNDVLRLNAACDVYVHSALWEGPPCPLAVVEAMSSSHPVILTDCAGWPPGFVEGRQGFVVKSGDARALASALTKVFELSTEARKKMGEQSCELARSHYDIRTIQKKFVETCETEVRKRRVGTL